jgi:hypothetical protein
MDQIPKWFKGARLNYAENALRWNDDHVALVCIMCRNRLLLCCFDSVFFVCARRLW